MRRDWELDDEFVEDPALRDLHQILAGEISPEFAQQVIVFAERAVANGPEHIARATFLANGWAKEESEAWYYVKDFLLRAFVAQAPEYLVWGLGEDDWGSPVIYIDLPGAGQISFHLSYSWTGKELKKLPSYPCGWTGVRNPPDLLDRPRMMSF